MRVVWLVSCLIWFTSINITKRERDDARREAEIIESEQKKYDKLLEQVRLREHEFNNHMTAILASHYTCETYDKLVETQSDYCKSIMAENKYNRLVLMQDKVVSGFLYEKLVEIEERGIEVSYRQSGELSYGDIPVYQVIEMVGILLDNAAEAVIDRADRRVSVEIRAGENPAIIVSNVHEKASYNEINTWFEKSTSTKGEARGLGLYHLKQLCSRNHCSICCENIKSGGTNWISFTLLFNV